MARQLEKASKAVFFLGRELHPAEHRNLDISVKISRDPRWARGVTRPVKAAHFTGSSPAQVRIQP
jgi:hypothetical protein